MISIMTTQVDLLAGRECGNFSCSPTVSTVAWNSTDVFGLNLTVNDSMNGIINQSSSGFSDEARIGLTALYSLTVILAIVGNLLVVIVFTKGRRCRTKIRPFLINLAIADLIMALFCMPFTFTFFMIRTWIFSAPMCPIVLFMQHLSVSASVFTNMAIGIDRFLVLALPLHARMTTQRAKYTISVIWICAASLASVQLVVGRAKKIGHKVYCDEQWDPQDRTIFTMFVLFITYIIPLIILAVTYSIISILMWKRTTPGNAHENRDLMQLKEKRKVIKMLIIVVIMFGLCWLPLHTFMLVVDFHPDVAQSHGRLLRVIYCFAFWLAMSNSFTNPIIYGFTNDRFRADLASLCYLCFPFCQCLKKITSHRFSMSTYDSAYNKRFSTVRNFKSSGYTPSPVRNSNRSYIELKRGKHRDRPMSCMNEFFKDSRDRYVQGTFANGRVRSSPILRQNSGESAVSFASRHPDAFDGQSISSDSFSSKRSAGTYANGMKHSSPTIDLVSPPSISLNRNNNSSIKLNPLVEVDRDDVTSP